MLGWLFRFFVLKIVRTYYAPIEVANERLSTVDAGAILVLNHPNGALDPAIIFAVTGRPVTFLAKSTPFASAGKRWAMRQFGAIPIFRAVDIGLPGGAVDRDDMHRRNEETFEHCRSLLQSGNMVALFPEGTSHDEPMMMPMRTGAARIALAAADSLDREGPQVIPVGLWFENVTRFRSMALVVPGSPIDIEVFRDRYAREPREAVRDLTMCIEAKLREVVLEAESKELLRSVPFVAAWTDPKGRKPALKARQARAAALVAGYRKLHGVDPDRLARIERAARDYARKLHILGIEDPWKLEDPRPVTGYAMRRVLLLLVWSPLALLGMLLSYVPYRWSAHVVRDRFPHNRSQAGALKLGVGTLMIVLVWILEGVIVGVLAGTLWGIGLILLAPLSGYVAVRWGEVARKLQAVVRAGWLRRRREVLVASLVEQRQRLAQQIQDALDYLHSIK